MAKCGPHVRELFDLSGRVAMVTGGCQSLGPDMAEAIGEAGADIVITPHDADKVCAVANELKSHVGVHVLPPGVPYHEEAALNTGSVVQHEVTHAKP